MKKRMIRSIIGSIWIVNLVSLGFRQDNNYFYADETTNEYYNDNVLLGDINSDSSVDIADALLIARCDAGLVKLTEEQIVIGDVNTDGNVDIADALLISRYDAGLIESLEEAKEHDRIIWLFESDDDWDEVQMVKDSFSVKSSMDSSYISAFSDRAFIVKDSKYGLIDLKNTKYLLPTFEKLECFYDGVRGYADDQWKNYDANGKEIFIGGRGGYSYVWDENSNSLVGGYVDMDKVTGETDTILVAPSVRWNGFQPWDDARYVMEYTGKYRLIGKDIKLLTNELYDDIKHDADGCMFVIGKYAVVKKEGLWGYIKEDGTSLTENIYQDAYPFFEGLAAVKKDGKAGFIKEDGTPLFDFIFEETRSVNDGLAWVKYQGKWGGINVWETADTIN